MVLELVEKGVSELVSTVITIAHFQNIHQNRTSPGLCLENLQLLYSMIKSCMYMWVLLLTLGLN